MYRSVALNAVLVVILAGCAQGGLPATPSSVPTGSPTPSADPNVLTTIAGGGGALGDGGPATAAGFCGPVDVALDADGNVYVVDNGVFCSGPGGNSVRRIDPQGTITTIAGTGTAGFSGDGGPATEAQLDKPMSVAIDDAGNLYIADLDNGRIRMIDANGMITTFAGTGARGSSGDGGPALEADLFPPMPSDFPGGLAFDGAGNLYVADGAAVRRIDPAGTITTLTDQPIRPYDVAVSASGDVYVSDWDAGEVMRVTPDGKVTTVAGKATNVSLADGIPATSSLLLDPWGVAVDGLGNLFIAEHHANRIRGVGLDGIIATVAGVLNPSQGGGGEFNGEEGPATQMQLNEPIGIFIADDGSLYIIDTFNGRVRRVEFAQTP